MAPLSPLCTVTERIAARHPAGTAGPAMDGQRLMMMPPGGQTKRHDRERCPVMA
jgi:hypothetical protein